MGNFWKLVQAPFSWTGDLLKMGAVAAPAAAGIGYGYNEWQQRKADDDKRYITDLTGLEGDRTPSGDITFEPALRRAYENKLSLDPAVRGQPARFGPTPNAAAYGRFLNTLRAVDPINYPGDPVVAPVQPPPPSPAPVGPSRPGAVGPSGFSAGKLDFQEAKPYQLLTPEQQAALAQSKQLDGSGMDADLEALKARYAGREARQESAIKAIEDRPYNVDLSPMMDLWKSWYGYDFSSYKHPETVDERMARVQALRDKMDQEATARDQSLYNMKSQNVDRKLNVDKYNAEQPIEAIKRIQDLNKGQIDVGRALAEEHNSNVVNQAHINQGAAALNETIRNNRERNAIDAFEAQQRAAVAAAKGSTAKENTMLNSAFTDATKKRVLDAVKGDVNEAAHILSQASGIAAGMPNSGATSAEKIDAAVTIALRNRKPTAPGK